MSSKVHPVLTQYASVEYNPEKIPMRKCLFCESDDFHEVLSCNLLPPSIVAVIRGVCGGLSICLNCKRLYALL